MVVYQFGGDKGLEVKSIRFRRKRKGAEPPADWKERRDRTSFVLSIAAFVVSGFTFYWATLRVVDDLRVVVREQPYVRFEKNDGRIYVSGSIDLVLMNSGSRPVAIANVLATFGLPKKSSSLGDICTGATAILDIGGTVVDEKKVVSAKAKFKAPLVFSNSPDYDARIKDDVLSFVHSEAVEKKSITICLWFQVATLSDYFVYRGIRLSDFDIGPDVEVGSWHEMRAEPYIIVHQTRTIFSQ